MKPLTCRHCGDEFKQKLIPRGFANSCDSCSANDIEPEKYAGVMTGEELENIDIIRHKPDRIKTKLKGFDEPVKLDKLEEE